MIKIGVFGAGRQGSKHLEIIQRIPAFRLVGFFDPDPEIRKTIGNGFGIHSFDQPGQLTEIADAVDITCPVSEYSGEFVQAIRQSKHVFVQNPFTGSNENIQGFHKLIGESRGIVQITQTNRFNPAFLAAFPYIRQPKYMEFRRKIPFITTGQPTAPVLHWLLHDIDLAIYLNRSNIKKSSISGVNLVGSKPDLVEARLEFDNGCVANFMLNHVTREQSHICHFYQTGSVIRIDMHKQTAEINHLSRQENRTENTANTHATAEYLLVAPADPLHEELVSFYTSITNRYYPQINIEDAFKALEVSLELQERLNWLTN